MMLRPLLLALVLTCAALAQKYSGPKPSKPDLPYLVHADNLVETEAQEAKEQKGKKEEITYIVAGANSPAKTPLASPIFLIQAQNIAADHLQLYRLESKNGQREILFSKKKKQTAQPIGLTPTPLGGGLYRIEVDETLAAGEYCLTPEGTNQVFCFAVF